MQGKHLFILVLWYHFVYEQRKRPNRRNSVRLKLAARIMQPTNQERNLNVFKATHSCMLSMEGSKSCTQSYKRL